MNIPRNRAVRGGGGDDVYNGRRHLKEDDVDGDDLEFGAAVQTTAAKVAMAYPDLSPSSYTFRKLVCVGLVYQSERRTHLLHRVWSIILRSVLFSRL